MRIDNQPTGSRRKPMFTSRTSTSLMALGVALAMPVSNAFSGNFTLSNTVGTFNGAVVIPGSYNGQAFQGVMTSGQSSTSASGYADPNGTTDHIYIGSNTAILNWAPTDNGTTGNINFLPVGRTVSFEGDGVSSFTVINRILPTTESRAIEINGAINSFTSTSQSNIGGNVWIYSPGGILVGNTAQINVGGLVLSTLDPTNFSGNHATFTNTSGLTTTGAVTVLQQAQIAAQHTGSYVAIVAPAISQQGTVTTDGAAAYVAAEQADITINGNLFDINITTGSDANNGFALQHSGTTLFGSGVSAGHSIYLVTMPKNSAVTLLLTGNTRLGFDVASSAELAGDSIVLSAGRNVAGGGIDLTSGAGLPVSSLQVQGGVFSASVFGAATGFASINSFQGQTISFARGLHLNGVSQAAVSANGINSVVSITGDAVISTAKTFGLTDDPLTTGSVNLNATNSGAVNITGNAVLTSQVVGQGVSGFGVSATGGQVNVSVGNFSSPAGDPASQLTIGGALDIDSRGLGAAGGGVKTLQGGQVFVGASTNSSVSLGSLRIDAGAGPNGGAGTDATAAGGRIDVFANGGSISVAGQSNFYSYGVGGASNVGTVGGSGQGGLVYISAAANSSATFNGLNVEAIGIGGAGANGANGGAGTGGTASLGTGGTGNVGQSVVNNGVTTLASRGFGGSSDTGTGGQGKGGTAIVFNAGGTMTLGAVSADASGFGGNGARGGAAIGGGAPTLAVGGGATINAAGGTLTINGTVDLMADAAAGSAFTDDVVGNANGGQTGIFRSGAGTTTISGAVTAAANGYVDNPPLEAASVGGGIATGGNFAINANAGTIQLSSDLSAYLDGFGGTGNDNLTSIIPGTGTGGNFNINTAAGATASVGGATVVGANGYGGAASATTTGALGTGGFAFIGGNGTVSINTLDLSVNGFGGRGTLGGNGMGGQAYLQPNAGGTLNVTGGAVMYVNGTGGDGFDGFSAFAVGPSGGSTGGDGIGGDVELFTSGGTANVSNYLVLNAQGQGGGGVDGGAGTGGFAGILAQAGGSITVTDGGSSSFGVGAFLSTNGTGGEASYGSGGVGGKGTGGESDVEARTVSSAPNAISTVTIGGLRAEAAGVGGNGGYNYDAAAGGAGGDGIGGGVFVDGSAGGGRISVVDATLDAGGFGGFGGDGGYDSDNGIGYVGGAGGQGIGGNVQGGVFSSLLTTATNGSATFGTYRAYAVGGGGSGGNGGYDGDSNYNGVGGVGGRGRGGFVNILARGVTVVADAIQFAASGFGGAGGDGTTLGAGGAGFGGEATVASTTRFTTTIAGTLTSSGGVVGNIDGIGGSGATTGAATNGAFTVQALGGSTITLGGLSLTNAGSLGLVPRFDENGVLVDVAQTPSEITALGGSTITVNGNISLTTPGVMGITADAGSLIAVSGTATINAGSVAAYVSQNGATPITTVQSTGTFRANSLALTVADSITTGTAFQQLSAAPLIIQAPNNVTIGGATSNGGVQIASTAGALNILGGVTGTGAMLRGLTGLSVGNVQVANSINLISNGNIATGALTATNGVIAAGSVLGQTSITPTAGTITANGPIVSGRSTYLSAAGNVSTGAITAGDGIKIFSGGVAQLGVLSAGATPVQSPTDAYVVTIDAQGDLVIGGTTSARGNIGLLSRAGSINAQGSVGSSTADIVLLAANNVTTGALSSGSASGGVYVANASMYASNGNSLDPATYLAQTPIAIGGNLTVNGAASGNRISAAATGAINAGNFSGGLVNLASSAGTLTAGNFNVFSAQLASAGDMEIGSITTSAGNVTANSGGSLTVAGTINRALSAQLSASGTISTQAITADDSIVISSSNGAVTTGALSAGQNLSAAPGAYLITVNALNDVTVAGANARTDISIVSRGGNISATGALNAQRSMLMLATGNVETQAIASSSSTGGIFIGNASLLAQNGNSLDPATYLALTPAAIGGALTVNGAITGSRVKAAATGAINTGAITAGQSILLAGNAAITTGALSGATSIGLSGLGAITTGNVTGGSVSVATTGGALSAGNVSGTTVQLSSAANMQAGIIQSPGNVTATSGGTFTATGMVGGQAVQINATGAVTTQAITATGSLVMTSASGGVSAGTLGATTITVAGAGNVTTGAASASTGAVQLASNAGALNVLGNVSGNSVVLNGRSSLSAANVSAANSITLLSGNNIQAGTLAATSGVVLVGGQLAQNILSPTAGTIVISGPITSGRSTNLSAVGNITTGAITAGDAIGVATAGTASLGALSAGRAPVQSPQNAYVVGINAVGDVTTGSIYGRGNVGIISKAGSINAQGSVESVADVVLLAANNVSTGALTSGSAAGGLFVGNQSMYATHGNSLDPATYLPLDPVAIGGALTVNGATSANLFKAAALGAVTTGTINVRQFVDLSGGAIATGAVMSSGSVDFESGSTLSVVSVIAGPESSGFDTSVALKANGALTVGGNGTLGSINAMGDVGLLSKTAAVAVGNVTTTGDFGILGSTGVTTGAVTTAGAGTFAVGNSSVYPQSGQAVFADLIAATPLRVGGPITIGGAVSTGRFDVAGNGVNLASTLNASSARIDSGAAVQLQGNLTVSGAVAVTSGANLTAANISGGTIQLAATGSLQSGALQSAGNVGLSGGAVTIGGAVSSGAFGVTGSSVSLASTLNASSVQIGSAAAIELQGNVTASGVVALTSGANLASANISGGTIQLAAVGSVGTGALQSASSVKLSGGTVSVGTVGAGGSVDLTSGSTLSVASVAAGPESAGFDTSVALKANGALTVGVNGMPGTISAMGDVGLLSKTASVSVGNVSTSGDVGILAATDVTTGAVTTASTGTFAIGNSSIYPQSGQAAFADLIATTPLRVGGAIAIGGAVSTGRFDVAANSVSLASTLDAVSIRIDSVGALQFANGLNSTGSIALSSSGGITAGAVQSGGSVQLVASGGDVTTGAITAARAITLTASGGISTGNLTALTRISASGNNGAVRLGNVESSGGAVNVLANGALTTGNVRAAGSIDMIAKGAIVTGDLAAGTGPLFSDGSTGNGNSGNNGSVGVAGGIASGFDTTLLPVCDDCYTNEGVPLSFVANYFGTTYDATYVSNNGYLTFGAGDGEFTPGGLGTGYAGLPIIAAFFADVDTSNPASGRVGYGTGAYAGRTAFGATWNAVGYYSSAADKTNTFQVILANRADTGVGNFDIYFNYANIGWETGSASSGVNGLGGISAAVGFNAGTGNQAGTFFEMTGSRVPGSFLNNGSAPLVLATNDGVAGQLLFNVRNGMVVAPTNGPASINISNTGASAAADITTGNLSAEAVNIQGSGKVTTGNIAVANLNSGGTATGLPFGVTIDAGGDLFAGAINATGFVDLNAGAAVNLGAVASDGSITIDGGSTVTVASLSGGRPTDDEFSIGIEAVGNVNIGTITATADVGTLSRTGNVTLGNVTTGGSLVMLAANNASTGSVTTGSSGSLYVANASMFGQLREGSRLADLLALTPVGTAGAVTFGGAVSTGRLDVAAASFGATSTVNAASVRINSTGNVGFGGAVNSGAFNVSGASFGATAPITAATVTVASTGAATFGGKVTTTGLFSSTGGPLSAAAIDAGSLTVASTGAATFNGAVNTGAFSTNATSFTATAPIAAASLAVTSNGAVNFGGAVTSTGAFGITAGSFTAGSSIAAGTVTVASSGAASFGGAVTAPTIAITSSDIGIGQAASLGGAGTTSLTLTSRANQTTLGGSAQTAGYLLDAAEFGRLRATQIAIAGAGDVTLQALAIDAASRFNGAAGGLTVSSPGVIRVSGNVDLSNMAAANSAAFIAGTRFEIATDSGRLQSLGSNGAVNGIVSITANNIAVGKASLLGQLATDPRFVGRNDALAAGETGTAVNTTGFLQAGRINFTTGDTLLVSNTGTSTAPAGLTAGTGGITVAALGQGNTPIDVVLYGNVLDATGTPVDPATTINAVVIAPAATARIAPTSSINGCAIGGACSGTVQTVAQNQVVQIAASIQSAISGSGTSAVGPGSDGGGPAGGSGAGGGSDDGDDGGDDGGDDASTAASSSVKVNVLIDTSSIGGAVPTTDTPVTSSGNSSLWGGEDGLSGDAGTPSDGPNGPTEMNP
jgi:filamentous hemagglutinin family protein